MKIKIGCVLLIDDDEDDNYFHRLVLEESAAVENIVIAESSIKALEYIESGKISPDIIFLDVNMPKMNGWEFVEEYEKINTQQKIKPIILMLTTSPNPRDKERAKDAAKINGFETKPLTGESFEKILTTYFS
jgi:CheY-like chemotaxis protein